MWDGEGGGEGGEGGGNEPCETTAGTLHATSDSVSPDYAMMFYSQVEKEEMENKQRISGLLAGEWEG